ncbi:MAG: UTP--glucose-1-phosphate uridylyltransferase, partial [Myxococcales bacterium]|nr:UTP--glucose-1-phosphate uridylyltransferase [Myxococcales bacterium]
MSLDLTDLEARLDTLGQAHLIAHLRTLDDAARARLAAQLDALEDPLVDALAERVRGRVQASVPAAPEPPATVTLTAAHRGAGEALLRAGQVAAFTVAGGQGTRLGHAGPKGTFPATPVTAKPLFQVFAEYIQAVGQRAGAPVPWYIMTSPENDAETRAFFRENKAFGLGEGQVRFFPQGTLPTFDPQGRLVLAAPDRLATNPDGHGGSLTALAASGALADMAARGVTQIAYFQVDNPLAQPLDAAFLGAHVGARGSSGEMSSKAVRKTRPEERVGVFAQVDGRTRVVEYSDLDPRLAEARYRARILDRLPRMKRT